MIQLSRLWVNHRVAEVRGSKGLTSRFSSSWRIDEQTILVKILAHQQCTDEDRAEVHRVQQTDSLLLVEAEAATLPLYREIEWGQKTTIVRFLYAAEQLLVTRAAMALTLYTAEQVETALRELGAKRRQKRSRS